MRKVNILLILSMLLGLLSGCGKNSIDAPELIAPVATNESYRTVQYGDIGDFQYKRGKIVPTDYCHFWKTSTDVSEIKVDIGQYVEKGQVVAVADIESAQETIDSIVAQKDLCVEQYNLNCGIYDAKKQELSYRLMGYQEAADDENINATRLEMSILEENHNYDTLLYEYNIKSYNEDISKYQEIVTDGTLVAKESGYVTYIKDLSGGNVAGNLENVVIISDYESCYVELDDTCIDADIIRYYPICYTVLNGEKYFLNQYEYTPEELVVSGSREKYPYLRLSFENQSVMPELGSTIPIFFQKQITENVLFVGNDSLYHDDEGDFVYVNNQGKKEKRYVELGVTDKFNSEVVSGLNEGELVFYSSESVLPENYKAVEAICMDYDVIEDAPNCNISNTRTTIYLSEYEGNIKNVYVKTGDVVNKGDLICTIETNESSAALVEMANQIENFKSAHVDMIAGYDAQITDLEEQKTQAIQARDEEQAVPEETTPEIIAATDVQPEVATDTDAIPEENQDTPKQRTYLPEELAYQIEQVKYQKEQAVLNYEYQLGLMESAYAEAKGKDDGTGASNIYAEVSGEVAYIKAVGSEVEVGNRVFNIKSPSENKVVVKHTDGASINQIIEVTNKDTGEVYTGRVSALSGSKTEQKVYLFTENGEVYITYCTNNSGEFYVSMDDESFYEVEGEYVASYATWSIKQPILIPKEGVHVEYATNGLELYYVWKIENEQLVKKYVELAGSTRIQGEDINEDLLVGNYVSCVVKGLSPGDVIAVEVDEE